jgi:hypothetical protein
MLCMRLVICRNYYRGDSRVTKNSIYLVREACKKNVLTTFIANIRVSCSQSVVLEYFPKLDVIGSSVTSCSLQQAL